MSVSKKQSFCIVFWRFSRLSGFYYAVLAARDYETLRVGFRRRKIGDGVDERGTMRRYRTVIFGRFLRQ